MKISSITDIRVTSRKVISLLAMAACSFSGVAGLLPPETGIGWTNGWVESWRTEVLGLKIADTSVHMSNGLERIVRRWTWTGDKPLDRVTLSVRYRMEGSSVALKPYIPGILLYGNPSNAGRTDGRVPVFSGASGEFAIFEDHRLPMPFALLEDAQSGAFAALHVLPSPVRGARRDDLWWSIGVETAAAGTDIVMLSGPVGYNRRRSVVKARQSGFLDYDETYITLMPGQVVEKTFWVQTGKANKDAFGFEQAMDASLDIFRPYDAERFAEIDEIVRAKRSYAISRWIEGPVPGACGFDMYDLGYHVRHLTIGWCGCAATCGYALPVLDLDPGDWKKAQRSLDFLCTMFLDRFHPDGLFDVTFDMKTGLTMGGDPVSCGQGLNSIMKAIDFAKRSDGRLDPSKWIAFASKAASAISAGILHPDWKEPASTAPGFLVAPLVRAGETFGRKDFIAAARRIADAFERRYFGLEHVYWGGTLDAKCEDKEGAYAAFQGYVALLRHAIRTGDAAAERRYKRLARHAMDMMLTYTMVWNATYPPGRLSDHAFKSIGWTVVSAQNQHLDAFGVLTAPEVRWMGEYLNDMRLVRLSDVMYRSCFQLTDASGSLGEQIQQTNFGQHGKVDSVGGLRGGYVEGWTVFWLTAHFLNSAADFREMSSQENVRAHR